MIFFHYHNLTEIQGVNTSRRRSPSLTVPLSCFIFWAKYSNLPLNDSYHWGVTITLTGRSSVRAVKDPSPWHRNGRAGATSRVDERPGITLFAFYSGGPRFVTRRSKSIQWFAQACAPLAKNRHGDRDLDQQTGVYLGWNS